MKVKGVVSSLYAILLAAFCCPEDFCDGAVQVDTLWRVTAYCPCEKCCGQFADGITASGHVIQEGDKFAAGPKEIPFNTILDIPGYGAVPVLDRGGAIKNKRLDVFFPTHKEALEWGVRYLKVKECNSYKKKK